jgi:RNA polymerase sigma-70 factor (ECF subfamily)
VEDSDEDLLDRYKAGDTGALALLVERYRRQLFSFILRLSISPSDADEVFQEVWLRVIRKIDSYRRDSFRGWVYRITHNLAIDHIRLRQKTVSLDVPGGGHGGIWMESLPGHERSPAAALRGRELEGRIRAAVAQLPLEQREVFLLRMEGDVPFHEIARVQRVSINTALARMHYALGKLRTLLHEDRQNMES